MSRVAKKPVDIPAGVDVKVERDTIAVKGPKGAMTIDLQGGVKVSQEEKKLQFDVGKSSNRALAGTMRAIVSNVVTGVTQGFERRLVLVGIGYRAQLQGNKLNLTLGFSHPISYEIPEGISIEMPTPTEVVIKGIDSQKVGQVAAEIRAFRPPEPYKGKGVKYAEEQIIRKEAKKK